MRFAVLVVACLACGVANGQATAPDLAKLQAAAEKAQADALEQMRSIEDQAKATMYFTAAWAILAWLTSIGLGMTLGDRKGVPLLGGFLGLLMGPMGVLIVAVADFGDRSTSPPAQPKIRQPSVQPRKPYQGEVSPVVPDIPQDWIK